MRPRLRISRPKSISARAPAPVPITAIRPRGASCSRLADRLGPPTSSRITSYSPLGVVSAPSACSSSWWWRAVPVTCAPAATPSCTAATPTPPAAPFTSSRSPGCSCAWVKRASCAVAKASTNPPASGQVTCSGIGSVCDSWTATSSAWPPPGRSAIRRSPVSRLAGAFEPGDVGGRAGRRRVAPGALQQVGAVHAGSADADQDLARLRDRVRPLFDAERAFLR